MKVVRGEYGSIGVPLTAIQTEICPGFASVQDREAFGLVLGMGLNVIQCVNGKSEGPKGGSLVRFDYVYVYDLRCSCDGCDKFEAFDKSIQVEKEQPAS
ncbi:MAG: hypothetical protein AAB550_01935 [Patescibacteria group bacterium]